MTPKLSILILAVLAAAGPLVAADETNATPGPEENPAVMPAQAVASGRVKFQAPAPGKPATLVRSTALEQPHALSNAPAPARTPAVSVPASAPMPAPEGFEAYRILVERNIFDMSRTGRIIRGPPTPQVKIDDFTLVGTISYENGQYCFFEGSSSEYRRNCKLGEAIADFKVTGITNDSVELQQGTNSKTVHMPVGYTISRRDRGPWSAPAMQSNPVFADSGYRGNRESSRDGGSRDISGRDNSERRSRRSRGERGNTAGAGNATLTEPQSTSSTSNDNQEDIIKRMIERRAKEVKDDQ